MASLGSNYSNQALQNDVTNTNLTHDHSDNSNNLSGAHHSAVFGGLFWQVRTLRPRYCSFLLF